MRSGCRRGMRGGADVYGWRISADWQTGRRRVPEEGRDCNQSAAGAEERKRVGRGKEERSNEDKREKTRQKQIVGKIMGRSR